MVWPGKWLHVVEEDDFTPLVTNRASTPASGVAAGFATRRPQRCLKMFPTPLDGVEVGFLTRPGQIPSIEYVYESRSQGATIALPNGCSRPGPMIASPPGPLPSPIERP